MFQKSLLLNVLKLKHHLENTDIQDSLNCFERERIVRKCNERMHGVSS